VLSALIERFPRIEQAGEISRPRPCFALRSMTSFPVRLGR
jgi:hypothetical protein